MHSQSDHESALDIDDYAQAQTRIRKLKARLPQGSVEDLAREVIRRLAEHQSTNTLDEPSEGEIEELCHALISDEDQAGARIVLEARTAGASVDAVYLKYLASAARMLGEWWEADRVSFVDVTLGTSRMYAIMRALRSQFSVPKVDSVKRAFFASVPGETHTLGVRMAADLLRKEGWEIDLKLGETHDILMYEIAQSPSMIFGLSAAGEHSLDALSKLVVAIRLIKPTSSVFVSGHIVDKDKGTIPLMDIDGTANDMETARGLLETFWERLPS